MRILYLSTWHPYPPDNGSKIRAYYLLRALTAKHDVVAVAFRPPPGEGLSSTAPNLNEHPVIAVPDDPFRHVNAPQWVKYLSLSPLAFRASPAMRRAVAHQTAGPWDAVVAVQMPMAQYGLQTNARTRVIDVDTALAFQMHERYETQRQPITRASAWISWQKASRYERKMLNRFQAATVVWQAEADSLQKMIRDAHCRITVIPNGVDCAHDRPGLAQPQPLRLVYNGALTYRANYDAMQWFLAQVYPHIKAPVPGVSLTITGSTRGVDLAGLALDDTVRLTGFVDDVRLPVAEASVCVIPIRQGGGTRLKILEAMALGTPVVATSKGAEGLAVTDGEHLLLADDPGSFARCTVELLGNAALRHDLAANARRLVEDRYDWEAIGQRFVDLVEATVKEKGQRTA
jgi:glycosyltransferase involved in cell wall biosynthesis